MIKIKNGSIHLEGSAGELLTEMTIIINTMRFKVLPDHDFSDEEAEKIVRDSLDMGMTAPDEMTKRLLDGLMDALKHFVDDLKKEEE